MKMLYEAPDCWEILLQAADPLALSVGNEDDDFQGGVPFSLRDSISVFDD